MLLAIIYDNLILKFIKHEKNIFSFYKATFVCIVICSGIYPLLIAAVGKLTPGKGKGETINSKW